MVNRRQFLSGAAAVAAAPLLMAAPYYGRGVAAGGYDVTLYFTEATARPGDANIRAHWDGVDWYFSRAAHRDAFLANPAGFAPQYGGYCAYAVARNYLAKGDPEAWTVHKSKLYLNYSKRVRKAWLRDLDGEITRGDANWPALRAGT